MAATSEISIYVKTLTGANSEIRVQPAEKIGRLKAEINTKLKLTLPIVRLVFDGKELADDEQTLQDYGVGKESIIIVVLESSKPCHFFFALDESGSMSGGRWNALLASFREFIESRHEEAKKDGRPLKDLVSVFFHETRGRLANFKGPHGVTAFDSIPLAEITVDSLVDDFRSGGNNFDHALNFMTPFLRKAGDFTPVMMFMTDGGDCGDDAPSVPNFRQRAYDRMAALKKELPDLRVYVTVVYTSSSDDIEGAKALCLAAGSDIETYFSIIEGEETQARYSAVDDCDDCDYDAGSYLCEEGSSFVPARRSVASSAAPAARPASEFSAQSKMKSRWDHMYMCNSSSK